MKKKSDIVIALLRGVNLGGHHLIPMQTLRSICESLGFVQPQTLLQSGNVLFRTGDKKAALRLETAIERELGFRPRVIVRAPAELRKVIAANPFAARAGIDHSKLIVTFLDEEPDEDAAGRIEQLNGGPEEFHLIGRELFTYYANGAGRAETPAHKIGKALGVTGTARNWNTIQKLLARAEAMENGAAS